MSASPWLPQEESTSSKDDSHWRWARGRFRRDRLRSPAVRHEATLLARPALWHRTLGTEGGKGRTQAGSSRSQPLYDHTIPRGRAWAHGNVPHFDLVVCTAGAGDGKADCIGAGQSIDVSGVLSAAGAAITKVPDPGSDGANGRIGKGHNQRGLHPW